MFYNPKYNQVYLDEITDHNHIDIEGAQYTLSELYKGSKSGKGGNSSVYVANHITNEFPDQVIKFCRYPIEPANANFEKRIKRFKHEIEALLKAKKSQFKSSVIEIKSAGKYKIKKVRRSDQFVTLLYYTMEKANSDLGRFLQDNDITVSEKLRIIKELIIAIDGLHKIGIIHRDIKPDNIFIIDDMWKIGDLGLIDDNERDYTIDSDFEKIGPAGYLSPEAINKAFGDFKRIPDVQSYTICSKSDVYQIGLLIWFILQGEIPVGITESSDLDTRGSNIFNDIIRV